VAADACIEFEYTVDETAATPVERHCFFCNGADTAVLNKVTLQSFVVPVTLDRKVGSFDIWGLDKTARVSYYVQGGIGAATKSTTANMVSGLVT